ncbi:MAG TPA: hypothetical protein VF103_10865 [Polyangiaceae bacterium]
MTFSARIARAFLAFALALGCAKSGPSPEERQADDERRQRELREEIERTMAPYQSTVEAFLRATSAKDYAAAYELLAPSYTNMVPKESFVSRIGTNKNFEKAVDVKILHTTAQAGTTRARVILGDLGLAEIDFATAGGTPKISSVRIGGMQALPSPP